MRITNAVKFLKKWNRFWRYLIERRIFIPIMAGLTLVSGVSIGILFQITSEKIVSQRQEISNWQEKINRQESFSMTIPQLNDLPNIIEQCRAQFQTRGVNVGAFNVERFHGEKSGSGLDYVLLRLHLQGEAKKIQTGLEQIEKMENQAIHVREVILKPDEGEVLLAIYLLGE